MRIIPFPVPASRVWFIRDAPLMLASFRKHTNTRHPVLTHKNGKGQQHCLFSIKELSPLTNSREKERNVGCQCANATTFTRWDQNLEPGPCSRPQFRLPVPRKARWGETFHLTCTCFGCVRAERSKSVCWFKQYHCHAFSFFLPLSRYSCLFICSSDLLLNEFASSLNSPPGCLFPDQGKFINMCNRETQDTNSQNNGYVPCYSNLVLLVP